MLKRIASATLIAGALDLLSAFVFAGLAGMGPIAVLRFVASGPFGEAAAPTAPWAIVGILVHFSIMAALAAAFFLVAEHVPALILRPWLSGLAYGLLLWLIMYWIVRPLRWPEMPLPHTFYAISNQLFSHCILVGLPIALTASHYLRRQAPPSQ
jgi:hypothetical protein